MAAEGSAWALTLVGWGEVCSRQELAVKWTGVSSELKKRTFLCAGDVVADKIIDKKGEGQSPRRSFETPVCKKKRVNPLVDSWYLSTAQL
jgi:hypothetical protein